MPGEISTAGATRALNHLTGTSYLALMSTAPSDAGAGTELTTGGYARQPVTWGAPAGDPATIANSATVTFGPFSGDPPDVGWCGLFDAATGGTMVMWWQLDVAKDAAVNESIEFAAGALSMSLD